MSSALPINQSDFNITTYSWMSTTAVDQWNINVTSSFHNMSKFNNDFPNATTFNIDYSFLLPSFIYVCLLLLVGLPGNALVIYVYLFKWPKSTSRVFILALATYDMINCTTSMPTELVILLNFEHFDYPVLCKISRFLTGLINNTTTFLLVVIAVDRFKRICRPHNKHISPRLGKKLVFIGTVFGLCTNWPMLILYGTMTIPGGKTCLIDDEMLKTNYPIYFVLFLLLGHFVTDCILITLYAFVGKAIWNRRQILKSTSVKVPNQEISQSSYTVDDLDSIEQERKRTRLASFVFWHKVSDEFRKRSNTTDKLKPKNNRYTPQKKSTSLFRRALSKISLKEQGNKARVGKTTLMLFLVTVVFIVSFIPYTGMVILRYVNPVYVMTLSFTGKCIYQMTLRSYLMNSVLNPIVYCFVSNQFKIKCKRAFKQIFCCGNSKNPNSRSVSGAHSGNEHTEMKANKGSK